MAFGSSSPSINNAEGEGSYYLLKYDKSGNHLWTRKHGTNPGDNANSGLQLPQVIVVQNDSVYVAGLSFGPYGGNKPPKFLTGADGALPFIAKFDFYGNLTKVVQAPAKNDATINPIWTFTADDNGSLYVGGSYINGIHIPVASAYIMKLNGATLDVDEAFGSGGVVVFQDGPLTVIDSLNPLEDAINNLQITNFATSIRYVPDLIKGPGKGSIYVAGVSDNGAFFGSSPGWNNVWYVNLDALSGENKWQGNYTCNSLQVCGHSGGFSLSANESGSFLWDAEVDLAGNLYLGGVTCAPFTDTGHTRELVSPVNQKNKKGDGFVAKIGKDGKLLWLKYLGTDKSDNVRDLLIADYLVYALGETKGTMSNMSFGNSDIYATRMDQADGQALNSLQFGSERLDVSGNLVLSQNRLHITGVSEGSIAGASKGGIEAFIIRAMDL